MTSENSTPDRELVEDHRNKNQPKHGGARKNTCLQGRVSIVSARTTIVEND
jgi:hypothetical protein